MMINKVTEFYFGARDEAGTMNVFTFHDYYNNQVKLAFSSNPFSEQPGHVWVICVYKNRWLLTHHPRRGLEFPGGKVEAGETPQEAAKREVWEETGGEVNTIEYIGQYEVKGKADTVVKNIYFATIEDLIEKADYMETKGPVILENLPRDRKSLSNYSFIMKDEVLTHSLQFLSDNGLLPASQQRDLPS